MKAWITCRVFTSSLGTSTAMVQVVVAGALVGLLYQHVSLVQRIPVHEPIPASIWVNAFVFGILGITYVAWISLIVRGHVSAGTGTGFLVSSLGLLLRVLPSFARVYHHPFRLEALGVAECDLQVLQLAEVSGIVFFIIGLAFVAAACVSEWRLHRESPTWLRPLT